MGGVDEPTADVDPCTAHSDGHDGHAGRLSDWQTDVRHHRDGLVGRDGEVVGQVVEGPRREGDSRAGGVYGEGWRHS